MASFKKRSDASLQPVAAHDENITDNPFANIKPGIKKPVSTTGITDGVPSEASSLRRLGVIAGLSSSNISQDPWSSKDYIKLLRTPIDADNHIEVKYRNRIKNRGTAITAMCVQCTSDSRKSVTECSAVGCPLWAFRFGNNPLRRK